MLFTLAALLGWSGLLIQLDLVLLARWTSGASLLGGLVNYFSFFTVLSNTLVAAVFTCAASTEPSAGRRFFLQPWVCGGITVSIVVVAVAYSLLLRQLWQPRGLQWLANELLHDVMPVLFALYWWFCVPKGQLRVRHIGGWALYPIVYFGYILLRGHLLGVYPYPFLDVDKLDYPRVLLNGSQILAGFIGAALILLMIDRRCASRALPD